MMQTFSDETSIHSLILSHRKQLTMAQFDAFPHLKHKSGISAVLDRDMIRYIIECELEATSTQHQSRLHGYKFVSSAIGRWMPIIYPSEAQMDTFMSLCIVRGFTKEASPEEYDDYVEHMITDMEKETKQSAAEQGEPVAMIEDEAAHSAEGEGKQKSNTVTKQDERW
jgi:hypothetical protein